MLRGVGNGKRTLNLPYSSRKSLVNFLIQSQILNMPAVKFIMQAAVLGEDAVAALSRAPPGNVVDCSKICSSRILGLGDLMLGYGVVYSEKCLPK